MIETLFIVNTPNTKPKETTPRSVLLSLNAENRVLDPKKSQNIAILLRALNVTIDEVCEALLEGICPLYGYILDFAFNSLLVFKRIVDFVGIISVFIVTFAKLSFCLRNSEEILNLFCFWLYCSNFY